MIKTKYNDFDIAFNGTIARIKDGVLSRKSHFHTMQCGYNDLLGFPTIRTVVLRYAEHDISELRFHTDIRSKKVAALKNNNKISVHFYDVLDKTQICGTGTATVHHHDDISNQAWDKTNILSRRCYLSELPPSTVMDYPASGLPEQFLENTHTIEDTHIGQDNFCVIALHIQQWDILYLKSSGNIRIHFDIENNTRQWIIP